MTETTEPIDINNVPPAMPLQTFGLLLLATAAGTLVAIWVLPIWLPGLNASLQGATPQVFWFLSRSSAIVAYSLLWLSMAFGLIITNKLARLWPGGPVAFDLHQYTSLLGLAFALFHALILLGDKYMNFHVLQILTPFATSGYRPAWVGLGQLAFYSMAIVALSFYLRRQIGSHIWRLIHYLSFGAYLLALTHAVVSGTDSVVFWASGLYWLSGGALLFLFFYRVLLAVTKPYFRTIKHERP